MQHIALFISNASNKKQIVEQVFENSFLHEYIDLTDLNGLLYSAISIHKFIEEEYKHDKFFIRSAENQNLSTMSSGQRRKAFLLYLIEQNPDFLILDHVYSNIDAATQLFFSERIDQLSKQTTLIQILSRKVDLLPCIGQVLTIDENNQIIKAQDAGDFLKSLPEAIFNPQFKLPEKYSDEHIDIDPLVQLTSVSASYGDKQVLNAIIWTIRPGEFWQLKGPNGSGKSTLLSIIIGDNPQGYGQDVVLFGKKKGSGESIWDIKEKIGYFTPAMLQLFTHRDSLENMIVSGLVDSVGLYTKASKRDKELAKQWLNLMGITEPGRSFHSISLGQQRMVMVARAMVKHPPLLILDEPTIELDDENALLFIEMMNALKAEKKLGIIFVSHRDEPGLKPDKVFKLVKGNEGYSGEVVD